MGQKLTLLAGVRMHNASVFTQRSLPRVGAAGGTNTGRTLHFQTEHSALSEIEFYYNFIFTI